MNRRALVLAVVLFGVLRPGRASAEERRYALVIGFNGAPVAEGTEGASPLRFADDDALAFYELQREMGSQTILLVSPDADTRRRYPQSVERAEAPTLAVLDRVMARLQSSLLADTRAGRSTVLFIFYSGHGVLGSDGQVALTLADGMLPRRLLYERVLDHAPADVVHLFVDACHAETIVNPRDGNARSVSLSPHDVAAFLSQNTLGRYPNVGVGIASSSSDTANEWDFYQSGVFTHELISALRGAADVNGDRRVEYSELGAFLAAANREVQDPRARLRAIVRAPASAPRAVMADLSRAEEAALLTGITAAPESFTIEDARGNRLVDGRPEMGFAMAVSLPANRRLFVRRGDKEAELTLRSGRDWEYASLVFRARPMRERGAVESALRAGLFLTEFGPAYYRGYVDREDAVAVPIAPARDVITLSRGDVPPVRRPSFARSALGGAGVALLASSAVFAGLAVGAWRDNQGAVERASADAGNRFRVDMTWSAGFLLSGVVCGAAALLVGNHP